MPKKDVDYSKIKAMAASILECIGDDNEVGASPDLPEQKDDINNGGQDEMINIMGGQGDPEEGEKISDSEDATDENEENKKRGKISMMAGMLKSKFNS